MVMAPSPPCDSSISLFPRLPSFPPQSFPTTVSSLTLPPAVFPQSTAALTQGLLHTPWTPAPSHCTVWGVYGCGEGLSDSHSIYATTDQLHSQP